MKRIIGQKQCSGVLNRKRFVRSVQLERIGMNENEKGYLG